MRKRALADRTPIAAGIPGDDVGSCAERSAVLMPFGRILYRIARSLGGPMVEVGTGSGVSTAYLAAGLARIGGGRPSSHSVLRQPNIIAQLSPRFTMHRDNNLVFKHVSSFHVIHKPALDLEDSKR